MARFNATGPRVALQFEQSPKGFQQVVGLYNMWQALPPETREWISTLFKSNGDIEIEKEPLDAAFDTSLVYQDLPEFGSDALAQMATESMVGAPVDWDSVVPMPHRYAPGFYQDFSQPASADVVSADPTSAFDKVGKMSYDRQKGAPDLTLSKRDTVGNNPGEFKEPTFSLADMPSGHYPLSWQYWRGFNE